MIVYIHNQVPTPIGKESIVLTGYIHLRVTRSCWLLYIAFTASTVVEYHDIVKVGNHSIMSKQVHRATRSSTVAEKSRDDVCYLLLLNVIDHFILPIIGRRQPATVYFAALRVPNALLYIFLHRWLRYRPTVGLTASRCAARPLHGRLHIPVQKQIPTFSRVREPQNQTDDAHGTRCAFYRATLCVARYLLS